MASIALVNPKGTEGIYEAYKFSQAVVANGRVDVAGQVGLGADFSIPEDIKSQTRNALTNLKNTLEAAGSSIEHVTHLTQYFTDISEVPASDEVFVEFFPKNYPARTVVQVVSLVLPQLKLEVQATAVTK